MLKLAALVLTIVGLAASIWLIGATGASQVFAAIGSIGPLGFFALMAWTGLNLCLLGAAWLAVAPGIARHQLKTFVWARATREAATDILPFSQFGGLLVGARTASQGGIRDALVFASLVADQMTELAAQFVFSLFGIVMLLLAINRTPIAGDVLLPALAGMALMAAIIAVFAFAQRPLLRMAEGLAGRLLPAAVATMGAMRDELDAIYRRHRRVVAAFLLHLAAWICSAAGAWLALRLMGRPIPLASMLTIEALIFTLRTVAFAIPGGIGVQEAAYVVIGPLFGLPPATALALSLVKRARDLTLGLPILLIWQIQEGRAVYSASSRPQEEVNKP